MHTPLRTARDTMVERGSSDDPFRWPDVPGPRFNWAHDWFDAFARECDETGLVIVAESGEARSYSFGELVDGSDRVGAFLLARGVGRGDAVILMLGNQVELWMTLLALIKIGAVIIPTTSAVTPVELRDRIERGNRVGHRVQPAGRGPGA